MTMNLAGIHFKSEIAQWEPNDLGRERHVYMHHAWCIPLAL
jgi:hypothetical protein